MSPLLGDRHRPGDSEKPPGGEKDTRTTKLRAALRASEEKYLSLLNNVPVGVFRTSIEGDGRFLEANPALAEMLGYDSVEELKGTPVTAIYPQAEERADFLRGLLKEGAYRDREKEFRTRDGRSVWVSVNTRVDCDEQGNPRWIDGIMLDLTERRLTEEALRESDERLRSLLRNVQIGVYRTTGGTEGRFLEANPAMAHILGFESVAELMSVPVSSLYPDPAGRLLTLQETARRRGRTRRAELQLRRKDGRVIWVAETSRVEFDADGNVAYMDGLLEDVTDRKRSEDALRSSEGRFRHLAESLPIGVSILGADRKFEYFNPGFTRITGYVLEDIPDKDAWFRAAYPNEEYRGKVITQWLSARRKPGEVNPNELVVRCRDGLDRTIRFHNLMVPDGRQVQTYEDITERTRAEEALRQSEERYRSVYDTAPLAFVTWDLECRITGWNDRAESIFGWKRDEVIGKNFFEFLIPEGARPEVGEVVDGLLRGEFVRNVVNENLTRDGRVITCEWNNAILRDRAGKVAGAISLGLDLTEKMSTEAALRESETRYRFVFENAHEGICIFEVFPDGRKKLLDCNACYAEMSGRSREELLEIGDVSALQDSLMTPEEECESEEWAAQGHPHVGTLSWKRPDDRENVIEYTCVVTESGGRTYSVGIDRDVTEKRKMESALRESEERLRQAEKMRAIGELAGGVAHDFNNQLAAIMGCAEMIRRKIDDEAATRYAEMIVKASRRASDLTGQLLAFARKGKYRAVPVDIHGVIGEVIGLLEHSIDKRIAVSRQLSEKGSVVVGDPAQLENALLNIALNARDAMVEGGELTFSTELVELDEDYCSVLPYVLTPGPYVLVRVKDTGTGMSPQVCEHIFEPFFTTKPVGKGTGMGLAAVYGTVKSHGGAIEVDSVPGLGTTFRIYLPVAEQDRINAELEDADIGKHGAARVMVVDDEDLIRDVACGMLRDLGYGTISCADGAEALEVFKLDWGRIDLVLLDMVMPAMNGPETFAAMKEVNPDVRVLLSSGYSVDGEAGELLRQGAIAFIQKPFRLADLSRLVAEALKR